MKTIVVASETRPKVEAAHNGFQKMFANETFDVKTANVSSGVGSQPMSSQEALRGASNRVQNAKELVPDADYWVGIEGGLENEGGQLVCFGWVVVASRDRIGKSKTGTFVLPDEVSALITQGKELADAGDVVFRKSNATRDLGAIGLLTDNVIDRTQFYEHAVIMALAPFKNSELY